MTWTIWAVFLVAVTTLCAMPGPAVLMVVSHALAGGAQSANWSILGIEAGNIFYYAASASGLGAALLASDSLFWTFKYLGAAYLVWLGVRTLLEKASLIPVTSASDSNRSAAQIFLNGFILQMANPKALLFYAALLPQFINPAQLVILQMTTLACAGVVVECLGLSTYGRFAARLVRLADKERYTTVTRRLAGSMLVIAGVGWSPFGVSEAACDARSNVAA